MSSKRVVVASSAEELYDLVADKFIVRSRKILSRTGSLRVILTGGATQEAVFQAIVRHQAASTLPWAQALFFLGDERFSPAGSGERNDEMAQEYLLRPLGVSDTQISSAPGPDTGLGVDDSAATYRQAMSPAGQWPAFDIALIGMGPDAHVLSVFPGSALAGASEPDIQPVTDSPKPPTQRVSMTIPLVNHTDRVWLVASGADKAGAVGLAMADAAIGEVPAAGLRGRRSTKVFIDQDVADFLPAQLIADERVWTASDERADYVPKALR